MEIERGPSLGRRQDSGVWSKMREFIASCSRINQSSLQSVSIWTKTNYPSWIGLVQQVDDLAEIAPFRGCISPTVCPVKSGWLCCHFKMQWRNALLSSATHLFFSIVLEWKWCAQHYLNRILWDFVILSWAAPCLSSLTLDSVFFHGYTPPASSQPVSTAVAHFQQSATA